MFEKEKTIEITKENAPYAPEEQRGSYELRRWTWYEKQGVTDRASEIIDERRGVVRLIINDYYAEMLATTVRKTPEMLSEKWGIEYIKTTLDPDVGDLLRNTSRELNGLTDKELKDFLEQSEPEKATPT